jgi:replicative DNA helicase
VDSGYDSLRQLPHNLEMEQALLGAILTTTRAYDDVADLLDPPHFFNPGHGQIFAAARALIESGKPCSPLAVAEMLADALEGAGGKKYLFDLAANVITTTEAQHYGRVVRDLAVRRELIPVLDNFKEIAYNKSGTPIEEQLEGVERQFHSLTARSGEGAPIPWSEAVKLALEEASAAATNRGNVGTPIGLEGLDNRLGGLQASDLVVIAGRPGMGKSALAVHIAASAALANHPVAFFSLEMSASQLAQRQIAVASGVSPDEIRRGAATDEKLESFLTTGLTEGHLPIFVDDTAGLTLGGLSSRARRLQRHQSIKLIIVDHMQRMGASRETMRHGRYAVMGEISRGLKDLAKFLKVPIIAISQLNRQVEARDNKRPMLSDLRETGDIEQDADIVMFLFREAYYLERDKPKRRGGESDTAFADREDQWLDDVANARNDAIAIIAKNRHGPVGDELLNFEPTTMKFYD